MYQKYYFYITIDLPNNIDACYYIGFNNRSLKKELHTSLYLVN